MNFKAKTEKEIQENNLLREGEYNFDVLTGTDEISKNSGNPMIKIKIGIYINGKIKFSLFDYLTAGMEAKLRHFCDTVGLLSEYEKGVLTGDMLSGRSGKCKIAIEKNDDYPPRNFVKDYVCRAAKPLATSGSTVSLKPGCKKDAKDAAELLRDDIGFDNDIPF